MRKIISDTDIEAVTIPTESIQNPELSLRDIGLLVYILSLPADWSFGIIGIQSGLLHDGKDAVSKSMKALQSAGYLRRITTQDTKGRFQWVWEVSDTAHWKEE